MRFVHGDAPNVGYAARMLDPRLRDPIDLAPLSYVEGDAAAGILEGAGRSYPTIGGVPFLVPDPAGYIASHRDAILAWIVEGGMATPASVEVVRRFSDDVRGVTAASFADDWTAAEGGATVAPFASGLANRLGSGLRDLLGSLGDPRDVLVAAIEDAWYVVEVGPGAGLLAERLADRDLLLVDVSPRALTMARERAPKAAVAVMEAESLALAPGSVDAVIAANVVDLLADPLGFIERAAQALAPDGVLVMTSPDPWPWDGQRAVAEELLSHVGLELTRFEDGLAWPREHGPRELQLYLSQLVVGKRPR